MNQLKRILYPIVKRQQQWRTWNMFLFWWGAMAITSGFILIRSQAGHAFPIWTPYGLTALLMAGTFAIVWINTSSSRFAYQQLARDIEQQHPELHATLLTAIEQQPDPKTGQFNFLQQRVLDEEA
ncbi:MAG: heme exporter protein CcmD [Planctomycetaceae bacterium]|nr:heme exporter protein CcmD [Planctomycetaceae bacterium]